MNETQNNQYEVLKEKAKQAVQNVFTDPVTVLQIEKNILLLKKESARIPENRSFFTTSVNFHDMSFSVGHYDMDLEESLADFKERVANSWFNPDVDMPASQPLKPIKQ